MNRNATAMLALLLGSAATLGAWRLGWNGPTHASVISATPVTVREPRYADVVQSMPMAKPGGGQKTRWDVAYRLGDRVLRTSTISEPGDQIRIGEQRRVIGYDVAWRWRDQTGVLRMGQRPGRLLPVEDGRVVPAQRARSWAG